MNKTTDYIVKSYNTAKSALNKDYSYNYHMERKKLNKQTSECSYEIIMIFHIIFL